MTSSRESASIRHTSGVDCSWSCRSRCDWHFRAPAPGWPSPSGWPNPASEDPNPSFQPKKSRAFWARDDYELAMFSRPRHAPWQQISRRQRCKRGLVGEAVRAQVCERRGLACEPVEQRYVLRVIGSTVHGNREDRVGGQNFDRVARLEVVLAETASQEGIDGLIPRRLVVHERVVVGLRHFMRQRRNVLKSEGEELGRKPTGEVQHIAVLPYPVLAVAGFEVVGVKSQNAAVIKVAFIQEDVVEREGGNVLGGDVVRQLGGADRGAVVNRRGRREE